MQTAGRNAILHVGMHVLLRLLVLVFFLSVKVRGVGVGTKTAGALS